MKNIFVKGLAGVLVAGTMASCSSDYLDLAPVTSVSSATVTESVDAANLAYMGMLEGMYCQYSAFGVDTYTFVNGEPWINTFYGDIPSSDNFFYFWALYFDRYMTCWEGMNISDYVFSNYGWKYCYALINQANTLINGIDNAVGDAAQRDFIKAGALTIRAHAYTKLLQIYAPRWEDSNNGEKLCVVLRLVPSTEDMPLAKMSDVLDQIYKDFDEAIALYKGSSFKRTGIWEPCLEVAQGLYSRACMIKHDYKKAQQLAHDARQNYPIMSADEYKGGFAEANGEWMWANILSNFIYYWAYGSFNACNGTYPVAWGVGGAMAINMDLYRDLNEKDIRRGLFFTPDKDLYRLQPEDFWNPEICDPGTMNINGLNNNMKRSVAAFGNDVKPNEAWNDAYVDYTGQNQEGVMIPFGAQYKFWAIDDFGTDQFPFLRAAELLLTEAEAAYECGDYATAKACLDELNAKRIPGYTTTASGEALRDEIRLNRRIELWGEGFNWFDYKRWNLPMTRRTWVANDPTSNNVPATQALDVKPDAYHGWRYAVPRSEYQYNDMINDGDQW